MTKNAAAANMKGGQQWHPTVITLLGLVLAEIVIAGIVRSMTKHGG